MKVGTSALFFLFAITMAQFAFAQDGGSKFGGASPFGGVVTLDGLTERPVGVSVEMVEIGRVADIDYKILHSHGSAIFGPWSIGCRKDAISDEKSCNLINGDLWIWIYADGTRRVSVGGDRFPGTSSHLRIDSGTARATPPASEGLFGARDSAAIIAEMHRGKRALTRYYRWPNHRQIDKDVELSGFKEAIRFAEWALQSLK